MRKEAIKLFAMVAVVLCISMTSCRNQNSEAQVEETEVAPEAAPVEDAAPVEEAAPAEGEVEVQTEATEQ